MGSDKEPSSSTQQSQDEVKPVVKELRSTGDKWTDLKLAARVSFGIIFTRVHALFMKRVCMM